MFNREDVARRCENAFTVAADKDLRLCLANDFGDCWEEEGRQHAIEALWRSLQSGLIIFDGAMPVYAENGRELPVR